MKIALKTAPQQAVCGIALDIGTTTLAGSLVDMGAGRRLAVVSMPNPQSRWGADVLSRINAIAEKPALLEKMQRCVIKASGGMISELLNSSGVKKNALREISAAGNSVMEHIFLGVSPEPIGAPPYRPVFKEARRMSAAAAGFDLPPAVMLYTFPLIGGFVGGDSVAVMLSTAITKAKDIGASLIIDIGTNSEIIACTPKGIFTTSAAAGPAFEGGNISGGMTAGKGAVRGVVIGDHGIKLDVVGGGSPAGICGSGVIDALAGLLDKGVIEPSGRIRNPDEVPSALADRIKPSTGGNAFVLSRSASHRIAVTQKDVRMLQVAKAAIRAGITVLLKKAGVGPEDVTRVFIAGAFGGNLKKEALARIGVLDMIWLDRVLSVGDAVLEGAELTLASGDCKDEAEALAQRAGYVPLSGSRLFEKEFVNNMNFTG
ncbi:MAG: DUF4445 domain-containing protein [Deltaproteobacteria bacterium]|nr:DUF4445 domain-containing protein [Deltaproteobacteria bacterium]